MRDSLLLKRIASYVEINDNGRWLALAGEALREVGAAEEQALLPFSALGSRIGLRRLYQYGQLAFLLATVACFFARNLPLLLAVRAVQALAAAASLSVSSALIRSTYPAHQLGRGLGVNNVVVASSIALAPTLEAALQRAYTNIRRLRVVGSYYRTDVGRSLWPPGTI